MGFPTHLVVSHIVGLLLRFETLYKKIPKTKDECGQLGPLQIFRKVGDTSVIRTEILDMAQKNFRFDTSSRADEVLKGSHNRMSVSTKPLSTRFALCDTFLISLLFAAQWQVVVNLDVHICECGGSGTA